MSGAVPGEVPKLTVTMLGTENSGKTTFVLGMHAAMASGLDGYTVSTVDHDTGTRLHRDWQRFVETGELPPANPVLSGYTTYSFVLSRNLVEELVHIDWVDYRGGAVLDSLDAEDTKLLTDRLVVSDSVYLVLDSQLLAAWLQQRRETAGNPDAGMAELVTKLALQPISGLLQRAIHRRRTEQGKVAPSLVVLLTKADALTASGLAMNEAFAEALVQVRRLLALAFFPGITTMVQPTQLGLPTAPGDPRELEPRPAGFQHPFLFTFVEYLNDAIEEEERLLTPVSQAQAETDDEIALLSRRLGLRLRRFGGMGRLSRRQRDLLDEATGRRNRMHAMKVEAARVEEELKGRPIFDGGQQRR